MKKFFYTLIVLILIISIFFFYQINTLVLTKLRDSDSNKFSGIFSAELIIKNGSILKPSLLEQILVDRNYHLTQDTPHPGQYKKTDTIFIINRRKYDNIKSETFEFDTVSGEIKSNKKFKDLDLEPQLISPLIGNEQTASTPKSIKDIPDNIKNAVLAVEDKRFYKHFGIDFIGILRAIYINLTSNELHGGSSITQQLAKNLLFSNKRSFKRKLMEIPASFSLEYHLTKDQILELYLNQVYLGQEGSSALHGVAVAAKSFFGKDLKELTLGESALLAGIIRAPSKYAPRKHLSQAKIRRNTALGQMYELKMITKEQFENAKAEQIKLSKKFSINKKAPFFVDQIRKNIYEINPDLLMPTGVKVKTGLDLEMQKCAEQAVSHHIEKINKKGSLEGALIAIDPKTGSIKAYVGGKDYSKRQYDHVSQAMRQIGSTIKPFIYLTALDQNLNSYKVATAQSILFDEPITIDLGNDNYWSPDNYDHEYKGKVTLRYALEHSLNIPAAYIGHKVGAENMAKTLTSFKISENILATPSLALGALDTNLLKLTNAYAALANGGKLKNYKMIEKITDNSLNNLFEQNSEETEISNPNAIYLLTDILRGVLSKGTASSVRASGFTRDAAGKTGTSNEARDAWFIAYTPSLVAGVWVGFDDNRSTSLTGGRIAAPIWTDFMKCSEAFYSDETFKVPEGITYVTIDKDTGDLASDECSSSRQIQEIYIKGTEPTKACSPNNEEVEIEKIPELEKPEVKENRRKEDGTFWENLFN